MSEPSIEAVESLAESLDQIHRVTIATDGGKFDRGFTLVVYLSPEDTEWIMARAKERRVL